MDNNNLQGCCQPFSVYAIYCIMTNMYYVGQTGRDVNRRINEHKRCKTSVIGRAIRKHGWENFDWWVLEKNLSVESVNEREKYWIAFFDCMNPKGYNQNSGGQDHHEISETTRKKLSKLLKGRPSPMKGKKCAPRSEEYRRNISMALRGKKKSPEHCAHLSAAKKGKKMSEEFKKHLSEINSGAGNPMFGRHRTEEEKRHLSELNTGENNPMYGKKRPEHSARMSGAGNPFFGRKHTEETKNKIRLAQWRRRVSREIAQALLELKDELD